MPRFTLTRLFRRSRLVALPSVAAYARWAAAYPPHAHNPLMQAEQQAMTDLLPDVTGRVVLDLACGTGRYMTLLRERGARHVIALDNSPHMLQALNGQSVLATLVALPFAANRADGVVCALAVGHLADLSPVLAEIARVLKPGGWALISDFHPFLFLTGRQRTFTVNGKTFAVEHYAHLYSDILMSSQQAGLTIEHVREPVLSIDGKPLPAVLVYRLRKN